MSLETEIKSGSLERGRFRYFPVVPGRLEFAVELRRLLVEGKGDRRNTADCRGRASWVSRKSLPPRARAIAGNVGDLFHAEEDEDEIARSTFRSSRPIRSRRALRTAEEIGAEVMFLEPDSTERPHLPDTLSRYLRDPPHRSRTLHRGVPRVAADAHGGGRARTHRPWRGSCKARIRWRGCRGGRAESARSAAGCHGDPAGGAFAATSQVDVRLLNPHPDCLAEITVEYPYLQERYEFFRLDLHGDETLDRPRVQMDLLREAEGQYTESTGEKLSHWQRRMIARYTRNLAHDERRSDGGRLTIWPWPRAPSWMTTTAGKCGRWRTAIWRSSEASDLETVRLSAGEIWINTQQTAHPPPASRVPSSV